VANLHGAKQLMRTLIKSDRLPRTERLEGLKLLRDAWDDYDVAMRYAERYKAVAILSFVGLFALSIAAVVVISLSPELAKGVSEATADTIGDNTDMAAFLLSSASGLLLSVIGLLNPAKRWRQLRSSGLMLESMIWQYRTRTGPYRVSRVNKMAAETALRETLLAWRESLVAGSDLNRTGKR